MRGCKVREVCESELDHTSLLGTLVFWHTWPEVGDRHVGIGTWGQARGDRHVGTGMWIQAVFCGTAAL